MRSLTLLVLLGLAAINTASFQDYYDLVLEEEPASEEPVEPTEGTTTTKETAAPTKAPEPTTQPEPPTTQPAPPTTQPAPPTTQPAPPTTQPAPPTTQPAPPTTRPSRRQLCRAATRKCLGKLQCMFLCRNCYIKCMRTGDLTCSMPTNRQCKIEYAECWKKAPWYHKYQCFFSYKRCKNYVDLVHGKCEDERVAGLSK